MKDLELLSTLKTFCELISDSVTLDYFPAPCLPHTMNDYNLAPKKVFYFGRDTYGWINISVLIEFYLKNDLVGFMTETSKWINNYGFLEYNNNKAYGFWSLAMKLHLKLKGYNEPTTIGTKINTSHLKLLNDFGYGNINSIEIRETLIKQGIWSSISRDYYKSIKDASRPLDKIKFTIDLYKPNLIFIFTWTGDEHNLFEGFDYDVIVTEQINRHLNIYFLHKTQTYVVWTTHPNNLRFTGYNIDQVIDSILVELRKNDCI